MREWHEPGDQQIKWLWRLADQFKEGCTDMNAAVAFDDKGADVDRPCRQRRVIPGQSGTGDV